MNSISVGPKSFYRGALRHDYWFPPPNMAGNRQTLRFLYAQSAFLFGLLYCLPSGLHGRPFGRQYNNKNILLEALK